MVNEVKTDNIIPCYRFVTEDLRSENGVMQWSIGEWRRVEGELSLCNNGLHACREPTQSLSYVFGERWFSAEARGEILEEGDKFCAREMRLLKEIPIMVIHQWAVDCAYRVLSVYEEEYPGEMSPRLALEARQAWIDNPCPETDAARDAASATARATASAVARYAARDAAWAAARYAASATARAVARYAAWAVASAAASATARDAEEKWQREHLQELMMEQNTKDIINKILRNNGITDWEYVIHDAPQKIVTFPNRTQEEVNRLAKLIAKIYDAEDTLIIDNGSSIKEKDE